MICKESKNRVTDPLLDTHLEAFNLNEQNLMHLQFPKRLIKTYCFAFVSKAITIKIIIQIKLKCEVIFANMSLSRTIWSIGYTIECYICACAFYLFISSPIM